MLFRTKSPLTPSNEEWQIACWRWLLENFGGIQALHETSLVLPTATFFPAISDGQGDKAEHIFKCIAGYMNIEVDGFKLVPQTPTVNSVIDSLMVVQGVPASPAGTFQFQKNGQVITYDPALVSNPAQLIATLTHELCHSQLLLTEEQPPGGEACEEFATDLAVTFFGLGIFGANCAFSFQQFTDQATGTQGWSTQRCGYLTETEWSFSLAVFLCLTNQLEETALQHLKNAPAKMLNKSLKYLQKNQSVIDEISKKCA